MLIMTKFSNSRMKNKWEVFKGGIFLTRKTLKHFEFDIHNYLEEKKHVHTEKGMLKIYVL